MDGVVAIVLAAGDGRRFGGRKMLASLDGRPLLEYALEGAAASPAERSIVVVGAHREEIERGVDLKGAEVRICADWELGPGASLRSGLKALAADVSAAFVTLGDEPFVPRAAFERLLAARRPGLAALRATYDEAPGHPVLIERSLFSRLGAAGVARPGEVLRAAGVRAVDCGDLGRPADIDTIADLRSMEAGLSGSGARWP